MHIYYFTMIDDATHITLVFSTQVYTQKSVCEDMVVVAYTTH